MNLIGQECQTDSNKNRPLAFIVCFMHAFMAKINKLISLERSLVTLFYCNYIFQDSRPEFHLKF